MSFFPSIPLVFWLFLPENMGELAWAIWIVPGFILLLDGILWIISLIAKLFIQEEICLEEEKMIVKNKNGERTIFYEEIAGIAYDLGEYTQKYNTGSSAVWLFNDKDEQIFRMSNPSLPFMLALRSKCKGVKVNYYNWKRFLYFFLLTNGVILPTLLLFKIIL